MNEYTTADIRDLDNLYLATIGGDDYFEERTIVKRSNGVRSIVGRASDWPLIAERAANVELTALLTASERHSVEAECHVAELLSRMSAYQEHIAALEAALNEAQPPQIAPAEAESAEQAFLASIAQLEAPDDGKVPCDWPGCDARVKPRGLGLHKKFVHGVAGKIGHKGRASDTPAAIAEALTLPERPAPPVIALSLGEPPWRCAVCHTDTHARSLERPAFCIRCVVAAVESHTTNGHQVAA